MKCAFYEHLPHYTIGLTSQLGQSLECEVFFNPLSTPYHIPNCTSRKGYLAFPSYREPKSYISMIKQVRRLKEYDLVHVNSSKQGISAYLANLLSGQHYIYTNHGQIRFQSEESIKSDETEHRLLPRVAKRAKAFVTVSDFARRVLTKTYRVSPEVIHHGVYFERFNPEIDSRKVRGLFSTNHKIVLSAIRLHPDKDPFTLLRAASIVSRKQRVRFVIIGRGILEGKMKNYIRKENLDSSVTMIPRVGVNWYDINAYYAASDLFVMPSLDEPFGLVVTEAMACGTPAIATYSGAFPEIIENPDLLFKPSDHIELADKITNLLDNELERREAISEGLERVRRYFTWKLAAEKYLKLYK